MHPTLNAARGVIAMASAALLGGMAHAATLTVTHGESAGPGSLREAIAAAAAGDTILFNGVSTVTLGGTELVIDKSLILKGAGVTLDAGYRSRVLRVTTGSVVRLEGLTITGGALAGAGGAWSGVVADGGSADGAGIHNSGDLTLVDVRVRANAAAGGGAGADSGGGGAFAGRNAPDQFSYGVGGANPFFAGGAGGRNGEDGQSIDPRGAGKGGTETGPGTGGGTGAYSAGGGGAGFGGGGGGAGTDGFGGAGGQNGDGYSASAINLIHRGGGGGGHRAVGGVAASGGGGGCCGLAYSTMGGRAIGGIFNAIDAALTLLGDTQLLDNVAAGGGGAGAQGRIVVPHGGIGVAGLWNAGAMHAGPGVRFSGNLAASGGAGAFGNVPPHVDDLHQAASGSEASAFHLFALVGDGGHVDADSEAAPVAGGIAGCTSAGTDCAASYTIGAPAPRVMLRASAPVGQTPVWGGDCSGLAATCSVTMDMPRLVTVQFVPSTYEIAATAMPPAGGAVSCDPNPVTHGDRTRCTAVPAPGYAFVGFTPDSGCASVSGTTCELSDVQRPRAVQAEFVYVTTDYTGTTQPADGAAGAASASISGGGASCRFDDAHTGFVAAPAEPPAGHTLPQGMFQFRLIGCDASDVTVTITWPEAVTAYSKWGKPNGDPGEPSAYFTPDNLVISGNTVSFTVRDGGPGDDDGPGNGSITDPSGPLAAAAVPTPVPTLSAWMMALLSGLTTALGARRLRRTWNGV